MSEHPTWSPDFDLMLQAQARDAVKAAGLPWSRYAQALAESLIRRDLGLEQVHAALKKAVRPVGVAA